MSYIITALNEPEMAVSVWGLPLLFDTEDEANQFIEMQSIDTDEHEVIEAPADVDGLVVS